MAQQWVEEAPSGPQWAARTSEQGKGSLLKRLGLWPRHSSHVHWERKHGGWQAGAGTGSQAIGTLSISLPSLACHCHPCGHKMLMLL